MLYHRWLETLRLHSARVAVMENEEAWTFSDLAAAVSRAPRAVAPVVARSGSIEMIIEVLRAWRDGQAVIPVERNAAEPVLKRPPDEGISLVKHTPGSCGIPRGIFLTAAQVAADADRIVQAMGLSPETPTLGVISPAHSYGFSNIVLPLLLHGVPAHMAPVPFPRVIEEIFRQHPAMVVPAVPSMWRAWHRAGILTGTPIALALSAGAPLSLALEADVFAASGLKIHNFYGASECGGISFDVSEVPRRCESDVGSPLPGVDVEIGADGRITVRSDSVAEGYDSPRDEDGLGGGIYQTKDHGLLDADGNIYLTSTSGAAINVAGRKVSPAKIEAALLATGLIRQVKVAGIPSADPERFQEISARVEMTPAGTLADLKQAAADHLQSWEIPRHWAVSSIA